MKKHDDLTTETHNFFDGNTSHLTPSLGNAIRHVVKNPRRKRGANAIAEIENETSVNALIEETRLQAIVDQSKAILPATFITSPEALFAMAKAQKEAALAAKAEIEYRVVAGQLVDREQVRILSSKIFSHFAQSMRALPDIAERRLGLPSDKAEFIAIMIDAALEALSNDLQRINEDASKLTRVEKQ